MSGFTIDVSSLIDVQKQILDMPKRLEQEIKADLKGFKNDVVRDAQAMAPVDENHLKGSISGILQGTTVEIIVATDYAAYVEFGTRSFAAAYVSSLPPDWQTFAAKYKGKGGGTFAELVERLTRWVRLKGISGQYAYVTKKPKRLGSKKQQNKEDQQAAYAIAVTIITKGSKAHPFLYPAIQHNKALLIEKLERLFNK